MSIKEKVLRDIALERTRQISAEGYTIAHDDAHDPGNLAIAGACYAANAADQLHPYSQGDGDNQQPDSWPWEPEYWKP